MGSTDEPKESSAREAVGTGSGSETEPGLSGATSAEGGNTTAFPALKPFTILEFQKYGELISRTDPRSVFEERFKEKIRFMIVGIIPEKKIALSETATTIITGQGGLAAIFGPATLHEVAVLLDKIAEKAISESQAQHKNQGRIV